MTITTQTHAVSSWNAGADVSMTQTLTKKKTGLMTMIKLLLIACILLLQPFLDPVTCNASPDWDRLANSIHRAENGTRNEGEAYGIHSVHYETVGEARAICLRTCRHKYRTWLGSRKKGIEQAIQQDFISYLATKYCPKNSKTWEKNVRYFYDHSTGFEN